MHRVAKQKPEPIVTTIKKRRQTNSYSQHEKEDIFSDYN
jgi:hypothetical protein